MLSTTSLKKQIPSSQLFCAIVALPEPSWSIPEIVGEITVTGIEGFTLALCPTYFFVFHRRQRHQPACL